MTLRTRLANLERTARTHASGGPCSACGSRADDDHRLTILPPPVIRHIAEVVEPDTPHDRCGACGRVLIYRIQITQLGGAVA